jgi:hypothetical protein
MPIREPGVIVYITGQQLPPPNPPTRLGYAGYVFARNGPFKTRAVLNSVFPSPFEGIVSGYVYNDISFLRTVAPLYGQLLPNLGHKACSALISYEDDTNETIGNLILQSNSSKLKDEFVPMFALPLWLNGAPKRISYYTGTGNINPPNNGIALHNSTIQITINGLRRIYIPEILNQNPNVTINNIMEAHAVIHGNVPRPNPDTGLLSSFSFIIWFHDDNPWPEQNNYLYIRYNPPNNFQIYAYFDYNTTTHINNISIDLVPSVGSPIMNISTISHVITFTSIGTTALTDPSNLRVRFSAVYFSSVNSTIDTSINDAPAGSPNPYRLLVNVGSDATNYELSYSPLDTGYYGFIYDNRIEMITTNNIYDHVTGPTSNSDANVIKVAHTGIMATGYFTDIPFFVPQHDLRWHYTRFTSLSGLSLTSPLPDEGGATNTNPQYSNDNNYVYLRKYTTRTNASNLYETWINAWNNSVLYNESDVRPIKESPIQADLLTDYGGTISFGFTKFIRGHDKFMFKVLGSGDLTRVRVRDMENYVKYYWGLFEREGFHYIRHQGCSTTGVTSSALYIKACFDYRYNAIFGINATLSLSDADFEFTRTKREELLEKNVNCIVKDRTLFLWYFNNNLTEEPRRDDSPLGEECNARVAIRLTKLLGVYVERYIGQPNNITTRARITSDLTNFINNFMTNNPSNMQAFRVICDESNNTPADIANNRLNIKVEARFGKSIKYIVIFERVLASL